MPDIQKTVSENERNPVTIFLTSKGSNLSELIFSTAAGVVPCGGRKTSTVHHHSIIVQVIFSDLFG